MCELPQLPGVRGGAEGAGQEAEIVSERLKIIETILKHRREEEARRAGVAPPSPDQHRFYDEKDAPDPASIAKARHVNKKTILNIGGEKHGGYLFFIHNTHYYVFLIVQMENRFHLQRCHGRL